MKMAASEMSGRVTWGLLLVWLASALITTEGSPAFMCPKSLAANCTCGNMPEYHTNWISCINTSLTHIPETLPDIAHMTFEGNDFDVLDTFPFTITQKLVLSNNNIRLIKDHAFQNLDQLDTLIIRNNHLSGLRKETFYGLTSLTELVMDGSDFYVLKEEVFSSDVLPNLQVLNIARCDIYHTYPTAFEGVSKLQILNMSHNQLTQPVQLHTATQLKVIDVSYNLINNITKAFDGLVNLTTLYMNYNELALLDHKSFDGLQKLEHIYLKGNKIAKIAPDTFSSLPNLKTLDVSHNALAHLTRDTVILGSMVDLSIHHNPWNCNCELRWVMTEDLVHKKNPIKDMRCAAPSSVEDKVMLDADIHVFDCPDPHHGFHSNTVALAVGLLVAIIAAIVGSIILFKFVIQAKLRRKVPNDTCVTSSYSRVDDSKELIFSNLA